MNIKCPNCGAVHSLDSLINDAEASAVLRAVLKLEHHYHPTVEEKAKGKSALNRIQGMIKEVLRGKSLIPPPAETATGQILRNRAKVEALAKREREQGLSKPKC